MTKEKKIEAIYKEMANKEKTFGCKYIVDDWEDRFIARETEGEELALGEDANTFVRWDDLAGEITRIHLIEIIWHPVMIGDALEVVDAIAANRDNARYERRLRDILMVWSKPRKPIDEQPDECIDLVYSLIQKD